MRGIRLNLDWYTPIDGRNRVESAGLGEHFKMGHDLVFRFLNPD